MAKRILTVCMAIIMIVSLFSACSSKDETGKDTLKSDKKTVAKDVKPKEKSDAKEDAKTVNSGKKDVSVPDFEVKFYAAMNGVSEEEMRKQLIDSVRIALYVEEKGITVSDEELKKVREDFETVKQEYGQEQTEEELRSMGVSEEQYVQILMNNLRYTKSYQALFELNALEGFDEKSVREFYDKNYLRAKHVLIMFTDSEGNTRSEEDALKLAQDVKKRLDSGESMDDLVSLSEDPGSKTNPDGYVFINTIGMDETVKTTLGQAGVVVMVDEFTKGTDALEVGKVSAPVKTDYGYHVIQRLDIGEKGIFEANLESVRNTMINYYIDEYNAAFEALTAELEKKYPVE